MKVKQLIEELNGFPLDMEVYVLCNKKNSVSDIESVDTEILYLNDVPQTEYVVIQGNCWI